MGFSFSSLVKAPFNLAKKTHIQPAKALGGFYKGVYNKIGDVTDHTYSPSLGGFIYRDLVSGPRKAQERAQADAQRRAGDLALSRSNATSAAVLGQGQGALGDVKQGYGEALAQVDPLREAERARVNEQGAFAQAQNKQNAVSRGLYNTSLVADSQRNVAAETSRAMADIENRYAQIKAQLQAGQAGATADVQSQIAQQTAQAGANASSILQNRANALANINYQRPEEYLSQLLGLVGTGAGLYYGAQKPKQSGPSYVPSQDLF